MRNPLTPRKMGEVKIKNLMQVHKGGRSTKTRQTSIPSYYSIPSTNTTTPEQPSILRENNNKKTKSPRQSKRARRKWKAKQSSKLLPPANINFTHCNIKGFSSANEMNDVYSVMGRLRKFDSDIFSLNEVNLDTAKPQIKNKIDNLIKRQDKHCRVSHGVMHYEKARGDYKPGGTLLGVMSQWASRVHRSGHDKQGRWSWISLYGKRGKKILLLLVYRVSQESPSAASHGSAYKQQYRYQVKHNCHPNPKQSILYDLTSFLASWKETNINHSIIIMTDSNKDVKANGPFKQFISSNQLADAVQHNNPLHAQRPTYIRSKNRIDYILISEDLVPSITTAGHYDFHHLIQNTDHCGIYMSLKTAELFDHTELDPTRIEHRCLQLNKREVVNKYLKLLTTNFEENNFWDRMIAIVEKFKQSPDESTKNMLIKQFDKMDQEKTEYMLSAEKKAGIAPKTGIYEWSPRLEKAGKTYTYWKARHHLKSLGLSIPLSLQKIQKELQIISSSNTSNYIKYKYQQAKKDLKDVQKKAKEYRDQHLIELAQHYAEICNTTQEIELKQIMRNEKLRQMARKHRWYFKGHNLGNVPYLLVPNQQPLITHELVHLCCSLLIQRGISYPWIQYHVSSFLKSLLIVPREEYEATYDSSTIHQYLLEKNYQNLRKTENTPFTTEPLSSILGPDGDSPAVDEILNGSFQHSSINDPDLKAFIRNLQRPVSKKTNAPIPLLDSTVTLEEWKAYLRKTRESTASASSGLHYGHYIACEESDFLSNILLTFMQLPFQYGFYLSRWENSLHCMIQKEPLPFLHRLWIVQMYEADFNSYMKIVIGRKLTYHAEEHQIVGDQSHGNRPNRSTQDALLTSRLISDEGRLNRRTILIATTDLCGCFDRIIRKLNTITSRREGLPAPTAVTHAMTIRNMKHRTRISSGLSEKYIQSTPDEPLEGLGQGNGAGPKGFLTQDTVVGNTYYELTNAGISITNPTST